MLAPFRQLFRQKSPRRSAFGGIHLHSSNVRDVRFVLQIQWVTELTNTQAHLRKESNWWPRAESNHRHKDFQSSALPTELLGRRKNQPLRAADRRITAARGVACGDAVPMITDVSIGPMLLVPAGSDRTHGKLHCCAGLDAIPNWHDVHPDKVNFRPARRLLRTRSGRMALPSRRNLRPEDAFSHVD